jgi:uncharacterized membrane protein YeaQ/YmgE (transglycosylase-associated protein family)
MLDFMWWIVIGFVAGVIARFLIPGRQPMSWVMTLILGLAGSVLGGLVSSMIFGEDPTDPGFHPAGLLMSVVGAIVVLAVYLFMQRRQVTRP